MRIRSSGRTFLLVLFLLSFSSLGLARRHHYIASSSETHPLGLGVILGDPSGFVGKYWLDSRDAVDGGLAFFFDNLFLIYSDYLYHFPRAFGNSTPFVEQLTPYVGIGGEMLIATASQRVNATYFSTTNGSFGLGVRVPLGIEWRPEDPHLGVFLELVPGVGVIPATFGFFQGGIGIRYYF